jgi:hypothetical protein
MAAATIAALLEGPAQRAFLAVAEARSQQQRAPVRGFTTLSATLGAMALALHAALLQSVGPPPARAGHIACAARCGCRPVPRCQPASHRCSSAACAMHSRPPCARIRRMRHPAVAADRQFGSLVRAGS